MQPAADDAPLSADEVRSWRLRFPILERCTYLINNSLGAMPERVPDALGEFARLWGTEGVRAWDSDWLPQVRDVADLLARLLGAPPGSVVIHQNVATLLAMVLSALPRGDRHKVVVADVEWPGHRYLLSQHEARGELAIEIVPTDGVHVDAAELAAAIDERTLLVLASHVTYHSACIVDVAQVCTRAREMGALSLVDGYHALGHLPVDVEAIGCDFYVGGSVKWLCGGPGVSYLYVRPVTGGHLGPADVGWLGHAQPFAFADEWEPATGAWGWLGGTPSVPAVYAAREGYQIVDAVGPARIRATSRPLTARLVSGAQERGFAVRTPSDPDRRAGAVTIDCGPETEAVCRRLLAAEVVVDYRPAGIRVGPHFFNTVEECDRLLDAMTEGVR